MWFISKFGSFGRARNDRGKIQISGYFLSVIPKVPLQTRRLQSVVVFRKYNGALRVVWVGKKNEGSFLDCCAPFATIGNNDLPFFSAGNGNKSRRFGIRLVHMSTLHNNKIRVIGFSSITLLQMYCFCLQKLVQSLDFWIKNYSLHSLIIVLHVFLCKMHGRLWSCASICGGSHDFGCFTFVMHVLCINFL